MQQKTFDILLSSKSWQQVLASVKESKTTALYDVTESQRAFLAAALSAAADRPVLYIASSEALASRAAEDAAQLLGVLPRPCKRRNFNLYAAYPAVRPTGSG